MPPQGRIWQELTWSWVCSTGNPASDQKLEAAAKAAWPYALLCGWTYLNDRDRAYDLMDYAVPNACEYLVRHPDAPFEKVAARVKSGIRRHAGQLAAKRKHELAYGSLSDLDKLYAGQPEAEQAVYARELLDRLSPFARSIVQWRWLGYSWREIAELLDMDHTVVRRAYFREVASLLRTLSPRGDFA